MRGHPERKHPRLADYHYGLPGYYYVTIHGFDHSVCFSNIIHGKGPGEAVLRLTGLGKIVEQELSALQSRYDYVRIDCYVIMPTHIHAIIELREAPSYERPGLEDVICAFKSLATRNCNKVYNTPGRKLFQPSFYESVLRNERTYQECWNYIAGNPGKWLDQIENRP